MKTFSTLIAVLLFSTAFAQNSMAQYTGQKIMENVYNIPKGNDIQGELTMTLTNSKGEKRVRKLKQYIKDDGNSEKKIMFFISPADVKGTSFMNWSYTSGKDDDQWIFLPALKRTKRISSDDKGDYFMGSDFTYDDLGDRHPNEDNHILLKEENVNGVACYVVESKPKESGYMYSKTITWVSKENFIGVKREFYDPTGNLLKILEIGRFEKISGFWTILETEMKNVKKNHSTSMVFSNVKINTGIDDSRFTERSMSLGQ